MGFDISKDTIYCYLMKNKESFYLKTTNDVVGFNEIHQFIKSHNIRKIALAMEATGIYYESLANYFTDYYNVYVINPLKINNHAKKVFNRTKTDKADAKLIADYAKRFIDELILYKRPENVQYQLNKLNILREQLKEEIKRHKNQIHSSKDEYIISVHHKLIAEIEIQIEQTNSKILDLVQFDKELKQHIENLTTIPCIKLNTALVILSHLLSRNFETANKFTAYAGLSPQIFESGQSVKKPDKLSRLGHSRLRAVLFMPALSAMRTKYFSSFVKRLSDKGKKKKVIVVALMRKLLKISYYLFKYKTKFDFNYLNK